MVLLDFVVFSELYGKSLPSLIDTKAAEQSFQSGNTRGKVRILTKQSHTRDISQNIYIL